jgi:sirohydrochlorin cobaltochelatase
MESAIVLAMHGSPPSDFPRDELAEYFGLHMRMELTAFPEARRRVLAKRHDELERRIVEWPRNGSNDPFFTATKKLATDLQRASGCEVVPGFNEFCAPLLSDALDSAAGLGVRRVVVVTPMMTGGGEHSERDIPCRIEEARSRHPSIEFVYAWPFDPERTASFLAEQVGRFIRLDVGGDPPAGDDAGRNRHIRPQGTISDGGFDG